MDSIGNLAKAVADSARAAGGELSRSRTPERPVSSTAEAPALFDRTCDAELPRLLTGYRPDNEPWELFRGLTDTERALVTARADALRRSLVGWLPTERTAVMATLGAMFTGFRSMRQQDDDVEGIAAVTAAVLRGFPLWAIAKGCLKISRREAGLDPRFAPNDTEIFGVVEAVVKDYRKTLAIAEAMLKATVRPPQALPAPSRGDVEARLGRPIGRRPEPALKSEAPRGDGNHAARVAADLAARRARQTTPQPSEDHHHG